MKFHYALVDDLLTWEEFEQRVEEKIEVCGDLVDSPTAAMMVVTELGRHHVKVAGLSGRSTLFSFFAKVIAKDEITEFQRQDDEKGIRTAILAGDETGTARLVLWDEKAAASYEVEPGDVLEVIGKHSGRSAQEITVLALRKAACEIICDASPGENAFSRPVRQSADLRLLALSTPRTFTRRDGTVGSYLEGVVGDVDRTARFICWAPAILGEISPPASLHAEGIIRTEENGSVEYRADEETVISLSHIEIPVVMVPLAEVSVSAYPVSCRGVIREAGAVREFLTRDGRSSCVRTLILDDGTTSVPLTLWGPEAERSIVPGEVVEVFHSAVRAGRNGGIELQIGRGAALVIQTPPPDEGCVVEGTIIAHRTSVLLDTGHDVFILEGLDPVPHGREVRVTGTRTGYRLRIETLDTLPLDPAPLEDLARSLRDGRIPSFPPAFPLDEGG